MPLTAVAVEDPLLPPKHETSFVVVDAESAEGCVMLAVAVVVHPFASVIVTV